MSLPVRCPLCEADHERQHAVTPHVYGGKPGMAFFGCGSCGAIYAWPRLSPEEERHFYAAEFSGFMAERAGSTGGWEQPERHIRANEAQRLRRMRYLERFIAPGARVLEIGCSSGFMLYPLADRGCDCVGVEPSGVFGEYVKTRGIPCFDDVATMSTELGPRASFDLVMHFFVLEHIAEAEAFLRHQLDLLRPGGVLVFEVPNSADALFSVYDIPAFERFYWSVAHHWYFNEQSLGYLLRRLGHPCEILLDQRYDLSNHLIWARDGKPGGMGRFTGVLGAEIEDLYREALVKARRCDTLIGVLRKAAA